MAADPETAVLVGRAQAGDRDAFGALYERLAPKIYSYLYFQLNGCAEVAEDLAEEAFLKVLEKLDRYQDRGLPFSAWVFRIAHNHLIDHVRARPKQASVPIEECRDLAEPEAERALERALIHSLLSGALEQLTEDQRRVMALRFGQGMSVLQTAGAMGKTEDAVKKLQVRGLIALRRVLGAAALAELAELAA